MTTVRRQGGIIQTHYNRITRLTENVSKAKYCIKPVDNCKKEVLKCCPKGEKMFEFCSKVKKVLKSAGSVK